MSREEIELLARAFTAWSKGPWKNVLPEMYWFGRCSDAGGDTYCIAEAIEALWRGF